MHMCACVCMCRDQRLTLGFAVADSILGQGFSLNLEAPAAAVLAG